MERKNFYQTVEDIYLRDSRYKQDAYEFVIRALHFTQNKFNKKGHISGKKLLTGIKEYGIELYGPMVRTVFRHWGVNKTSDFGNIVFNMIDKGLLSKTDRDSINDFKDVYDLDAVFANVLADSIVKDI